jgi:hypothetical protein
MVDKLTKDLLDKIIIVLNKPENKLKLENDIIGPIICNISNKLYPYICLVFTLYIINIILIIVILVIVILYNKSKNNLNL